MTRDSQRLGDLKSLAKRHAVSESGYPLRLRFLRSLALPTLQHSITPPLPLTPYETRYFRY